MKKWLWLTAALAAGMVIMSGCGEKEKPAAAPASSSPQIQQNAAAASPSQAPSTVVTSPSPSPKNGDLKWTTYAEDGLTFSFKYPEEWEAVDKADFPDPLIQAFVGTYEEADDFSTNVNVTVVDNIGLAPSAAQVAEQTLEMYKTMMPSMGLSDFKKTSFEPKDYGKYKAGILTCTYTVSQTDTKVVMIQYLVPVGKTSYTLTATLLHKDLAKYEPIVNEIINSFEVKQ
ncbi:MAG: hypothetical protein K0R57_2077 [Paenibacillaceae bacterium]|jgi:hypothetical protein|nr:hypothetical protein [Paenibacillaceae bacterium]